MKAFIFVALLCVLFYRHSLAAGPIGTFIQTNAIGFPVLHEHQTWIFDPDVGLRRRREFIELNGDKGEKLIERLGLGIDGYSEERLRQQRLRDQGHLGGLNALRP
ncbi:uncharacterized protein LOC123703185 isoform X3 [Colias croceus]|uniref:uncharacterized protein LOC123703185 isoform X3 n=1 Tax=Colias crocea TaxID=72248 RepID=UPI001E27E729|nr:uncharacterized protein LOC123703185 isoform X3 [Colias croceus]